MYHFYSNSTDGNRVSVAGQHSEGVLKLAVSRCSNKDNFVRKKGRLIAEGRLLKGKLHSEYPMEVCDIQRFVEIAKNVSKDVISDPRNIFMNEPKLRKVV